MVPNHCLPGEILPQIPNPRLLAAVLAILVISLGQIPFSLASPKGPDTMHIDRNGSLPSNKGPAEYFTGNVRIDMQFQREAPSRAAGATVTFEPGARTAWHSHPLGQTLIVTFGKGWTHRHWHGATPTTAMTHIAIQEALDGKVVTWMEHVSDEEYSAGRPTPHE